MFLTILFCVFLCPHSPAALADSCRLCGPEIECRDLCDCRNHTHSDQCELESSLLYELRNNTFSVSDLVFNQFVKAYASQLLDEIQHLFCAPQTDPRLSSYTFVIRHLNSIVLRV